MTYTNKTLAKIGKEVINNHPDIASVILEQMPAPMCNDLSKIPHYLIIFCQAISIDPSSIRGPVYKSSIAEIKKMFVSAMVTLYNEPHCFSKEISLVLDQDPSITSRMIREVKFRYKKDEDFINKVNIILNTITNTNDKRTTEITN